MLADPLACWPAELQDGKSVYLLTGHPVCHKGSIADFRLFWVILVDFIPSCNDFKICCWSPTFHCDLFGRAVKALGFWHCTSIVRSSNPGPNISLFFIFCLLWQNKWNGVSIASVLILYEKKSKKYKKKSFEKMFAFCGNRTHGTLSFFD